MKEHDKLDVMESLEDNHQGRNAQRIRIYLGIKQEVMAKDLGILQSQVSAIEQQPVIEERCLLKLKMF